jgi:predicted site-specific integrase-resolvase
MPEALKRVGISRATLYRWIASGRVPDSGQRDRNGHRLFTQQELDALAEFAGTVTPIPRAATTRATVTS